MATELQRQALSHKKKQERVQSLEYGAASIFLGAKEAAAIDVSAVHEAALQSLRDLSQYDSRFGLFESSLLHSSSIGLQRELKTKEENEAIDVEIGNLLPLLALWAHENRSHLVLEYLLRRYRVHEFNVDILLDSFLILHETKVFAKIVQQCRLADTPWIYLAGVKSTGVAPPRAFFVEWCLRSNWFLQVLISSCSRSLRFLGIRKPHYYPEECGSSSYQGGSRMMAITNAIIMEAAERAAFSDEMMRSVYPFLLEGLKCKARLDNLPEKNQLILEWKCASCMILSQLCRKTVFGEKLSKTISKGIASAITAIGKNEEHRAISHMLFSLAIILAQHQQLSVTPKLIAALLAGTSAEELNSQYSGAFQAQYLLTFSADAVAPLISTLLMAVINLVFQRQGDKDSQGEADQVNRFVYLELLHTLIQHQRVSEQQALSLITKIIDRIMEADAFRQIEPQMFEVTTSLANFYPKSFGMALKAVFNDQSRVDGQTVLREFLLTATQNQQVSSENGSVEDSLFFALNSPIKEMRIKALEAYRELPLLSSEAMVTPDQRGLADMVINNMQDLDVEVAIAAWNANTLTKVIQAKSAQFVATVVQQVWQFWVNEDLSNATAALQINIIGSILDSSLAESAKMFVALTTLFVMESTIELQQLALRFLVSTCSLPTAGRKSTEQPSVQAIRLIAKKVQGDVEEGEKLLKTIFIGPSQVSSLEYTKAIGRFSVMLIKQFCDSNVLHTLLQSITLLLLTNIIASLRLERGEHQRSLLSIFAQAEMVPYYIVKSISVMEENGFFQQCLQPIDMDYDYSLSLMIEIIHASFQEQQLTTQILCRFDNATLGLILARLAFADYLNGKVEVQVQVAALSLLKTLLLASSILDNDFIQSIAYCSLFTCSSSSALVRKHSVRLLEVLSSSTLPSAGGKKGSNAALQALLSAVSKRADLIVLEADAIRMVVTEFLSASAGNKEEISSLIQSFAEAAMLIDSTDRRIANFFLSLLPSASSQVILWSLYFRLLQERTENVTSANSRSCEEILLKMVTCLDQIENGNDRNQFFVWIIKQIEKDHVLNRLIMSTIMPMIPKAAMTSTIKEAIFRALMQRHLRSNGDSDDLVLAAMKSLQVDATIALNMLRDAVELGEDFDAVIRIRKNSIVDEDEHHAMDVEGEEKTVKDDPVAAKLLQMVSITEIALPLTMDENMTVQNLSIALRLAFMVLEKLSQPGALKVLSIEYFKGVVMESIFSLLTFVDHQIDGGLVALLNSQTVPTTATKGKGSRASRKINAADESTLPGYSRDRIGTDIHAIVTCLSSVRSSSMHHAAIETMRMLIASEETGKQTLIASIGQILSSITGSLLISKGKLLTHLLQLILPNEEGVAISKEAISVTQNMICKLLAYVPNMSLAQKWSLLRSITKTHVNGELLNALVIHSLLVMTSVAYHNDRAKHEHVVVESISLSRAAQRRAQRVNQSSEYEEYFMLAQQFLLEQSPLVIVHTLNKVLNAAEVLVFHSLSITSEVEEEHEVTPLDLSISLQTFAELRSIASLSTGEGLSVSASLAILHQEYVREVLLQKSFHRLLASEKAAPPLLIELAESCLTLCVHCDEAAKTPINDRQEQISLLLENEVHVISQRSFADITGKLTLNILGEMQVLLDGPSFLTIIQELLDHEIVSIRQKAILFLKERLQGLLGNRSVKGKAQDELFLELFERLSDIFLRSCETATASTDQVHVQSLVMAQSVLLSLDVMILHLGTRSTWQTAVTKKLENYLQFIPKLSMIVSSQKASSGAIESRKLLGSILLSCSSICTALKAALMPSLQQIMSAAMSLLQEEIELWRDSTAATRAVLDSDRRGHCLFMRSLLAAFSVIISSLPSLCHSYLPRLLPLLLDCQVGLRPETSSDRDLKGVAEDAETCLQTISMDIPPRLSLPVLCNILATTVESRNIAASVRFAVLITNVLKKADRITTLSNQVKLVSAFQYLFALREQRTMEVPTNTLLDANMECIAEFCMKLTENELKSFILRLMEWKAAESINEQSKRVRVVSFLATIRLLLERFQTLFYSSIALTWASMMENDLTQSRQNLLAIVDEVSARDGNKKRRRLTEAFAMMDESEQFEVLTIVEGVEHILVILRLLSDSSSFIDETRYDSAYPTILSFVPLRGAFATDDDYFAFNSEFVYPAIAGLCQAVGKDLLWKPLNHQLLLITRSNVTVVRIAAVDLLKFMFESLGEEYLAVLPECLPFLSELLEDENQEVSKHTRAVVTVIEELSGENLDTYLQT